MTDIDWVQENTSFKFLANAMPQLVWLYEPISEKIWYNQTWYEKIGEAPEKLQDLIRIIAELNARSIPVQLDNHLNIGQSFEEILLLPGRKGGHECFMARIQPIRDAEGKILQWFGIFTNVKAEITDNFFRDKERLELATEAAEIGVWDYDLLTGASYWSDKTRSIFGFTPEEFTGTMEQINERIHPDDRDTVKTAAFANRTQDDRYSVEFRVLLPDGSTKWLMTLGKTYSDNLGNPSKLIGVTLDITERKEVESRLIMALQSRDDFISIASHELRTPLSALLMQLQITTHKLNKLFTEENLKDPVIAMIRESVVNSERQALRLSGLINKILDLSQLSSGKLELQKSDCDLAIVLQNLIQSFRYEAEKEHIEISTIVHSTKKGKWDTTRIGQVLSNLISNAIKYGDKKPIQIEISEDDSHRNAVITVTDHGGGIPYELQEKIFHRFERVKNPKNISGLGLGLYISKQIVEAHHGRIKVESIPSGKTTFTVQLPY